MLEQWSGPEMIYSVSMANKTQMSSLTVVILTQETSDNTSDGYFIVNGMDIKRYIQRRT